MEPFGGCEPLVGSIRALRTFRIDANGLLYPVHSDDPWTAGTNTARCLAVDAGSPPHGAPDWDCNCGFYAYGADIDTVEQPRARHLVAAVSMWGHVVAGTRGVRAQHARIEAVWADDHVAPRLLTGLGLLYPGVALYRDKATFLESNPPTQLDCYLPPSGEAGPLPRATTVLITTAALVLGCLGEPVIVGHWFLLVSAVVAGIVLAARAVILHRRSRDRRDRAAALSSLAAALWLACPFAGPAGFLLLRLPMLQIALLGSLMRRRVAAVADDIPSVIGSMSASAVT